MMHAAMHELSIVMSILDCVAEQVHRHGGDVKIAAIHLSLGPLSGVVKEALVSAYDRAIETSEFSGAKLVIRETPVIAYCSTCDREQTLASIQEMRCPVCRTPTPDIRGGRELEVTALEICE